MSREDAWINRYFDWLYRNACGNLKYRKLLMLLHDTEFVYDIHMDVNRARDGEDLRFRFAYETTHNDDINEIISVINNKPCSVLEMMLALCIRCDETIIYDPDFGSRAGSLFMDILKNMGLANMTDEKFNKERAKEIIHRMMHHLYLPNGEGGCMFVIHTNEYDMRKTEIWYQMQHYLNEYN